MLDIRLPFATSLQVGVADIHAGHHTFAAYFAKTCHGTHLLKPQAETKILNTARTFYHRKNSLARIFSADALLFFLIRSGGRSLLGSGLFTLGHSSGAGSLVVLHFLLVLGVAGAGLQQAVLGSHHRMLHEHLVLAFLKDVEELLHIRSEALYIAHLADGLCLGTVGAGLHLGHDAEQEGIALVAEMTLLCAVILIAVDTEGFLDILLFLGNIVANSKLVLAGQDFAHETLHCIHKTHNTVLPYK